MQLVGAKDSVDGPTPDATLPWHSWDYWLDILHVIPEQLSEALEARRSLTEILDVQLGVLAWVSSFEGWRHLSVNGESVVMYPMLLERSTLKSGDEVFLVGSVLRVRHVVWVQQRKDLVLSLDIQYCD